MPAITRKTLRVADIEIVDVASASASSPRVREFLVPNSPARAFREKPRARGEDAGADAALTTTEWGEWPGQGYSGRSFVIR